MATKKTEEISDVRNMTKHEMAKIIKTARRQAKPSEKENVVSVCDVMKNNTSEIIQKIESKFPTYAQLYTDLYTKYLHTIDDFYGTCYLSEKEFLNKLGIDQSILGAYELYWNSITEMILKQIDTASDLAKMYVKFRLATIDSYDKVAHLMMDRYARAWSQFNSYDKKSRS